MGECSWAVVRGAPWCAKDASMTTKCALVSVLSREHAHVFVCVCVCVWGSLSPSLCKEACHHMSSYNSRNTEMFWLETSC